jgi:small conductance mechanosensitive channel
MPALDHAATCTLRYPIWGTSDEHMQRNLHFRVWLAPLIAACLLASAPALAAPPEQAEPPGRPIELRAAPELDRVIEQRLRSIYSEMEAFRDVEVEVRAGVVHLSGTVQSVEAAGEAKAIAERLDRVAAVTSDVRQEVEISRRLGPVFEQMRTRVGGWLSYLPLIALALATVSLAWFLARMISRRRRKREEPDSFIRLIADQLLQGTILAIGIAIALELLGARGLLGAMVGTASVIGIVIGIAFKNIGEAYIASILLSMRRPFDPNDYVRIEEFEGSVVRLTSRATVLMTVDGNLASIPNSKVFGATIINFTRNPQRRFIFKLGVGTEADLCQVQKLAVSTLAAMPGVLSKPPPVCLIDEFGDPAIVISVAGWVDQRESDWLKVSSEAKRRIKVAFDQAGIDVPEPVMRIRSTLLEPRTEKPEPQADASLDVSPDEHIDRQVEEERASSAENDLLSRRPKRGA